MRSSFSSETHIMSSSPRVNPTFVAFLLLRLRALTICYSKVLITLIQAHWAQGVALDRNVFRMLGTLGDLIRALERGGKDC